MPDVERSRTGSTITVVESLKNVWPFIYIADVDVMILNQMYDPYNYVTDFFSI
jgi:hypothetical protein